MRRTWMWQALCKLLLGMSLLGGAAMLQAASLSVLAEHDTAAVQSFQHTLQAQRRQDTVSLVTLSQAAATPSPQGTWILLGDKALTWHLQHNANAPALALLISQQQTQHLNIPANLPLTLLWREAPASRQLKLGQLLMPLHSRVGVLFSAASQQQLTALEQTAQQRQVKLVSKSWDGTFPSSQVQRVLEDSQWLLALDDPSLFNPTTIKPLLLGAYRQKRVLIGPNAGYVQAGSLASTYSDQQDWLQQLNELLDMPAKQRPRSAFARYFKVMLNQQVAHSLGLTNADAAQLAEQLRQGEQP